MTSPRAFLSDTRSPRACNVVAAGRSKAQGAAHDDRGDDDEESHLEEHHETYGRQLYYYPRTPWEYLIVLIFEALRAFIFGK